MYIYTMETVTQITTVITLGILSSLLLFFSSKVAALKKALLRKATITDQEGNEVTYGFLIDGEDSYAFSNYEMNKAKRRFIRAEQTTLTKETIKVQKYKD